MADSLTKVRRSWNMSRIKGKDTAPEKIVRSLLHRMGLRFRCQQRIVIGLKAIRLTKRLASLPKTLSIKPDVILAKHQTVVLVHGCFWHRHKNCKDATMPKTRREWWQSKLEGNAARDRRNQAALRRAGWRVLTVWECETEKPENLTRRLALLLRVNYQ